MPKSGTSFADYFHSPETLDAVTREQLLSQLNDGTVTILDVRPEDEFLLGHTPGALNMPFEQLATRLAELPKDREIVAFYRGPCCVFSFEAEKFLRRQGFRVHRLEEGLLQWKASGLHVEFNQAGASAAECILATFLRRIYPGHPTSLFESTSWKE